MRKKLLCLVAIGIIATSLCACGGKEEPKPSTNTKVAEEQPTEEPAPTEVAEEDNTKTAAPVPSGEVTGTIAGWEDDHSLAITIDKTEYSYQVLDENLQQELHALKEGDTVKVKTEFKDEMYQIVEVLK